MANPLDQVASWPATAAAGVASAAGLMESAGPVTQPFRWASVTKLLVALAALDAVQRGLLDLDEPAGPPGATVRHLLSHASGLAFDSDAVLGPPGRRRVYSNRGIEIVADTVAARCGQRFERLLAEATSVAFPGLSGVLPGFGRQEHNDWGLGFEIRDAKSPHWTGSRNSPRTFGHFGQSGSFLWVDPDAGLACVSLADENFGDWARQAWPKLSDDLIAAYG